MALAFTSCSHGDDEPFKDIVIANSPEMFNLVTREGSRANPEVTDGVSYYIVFDDVKRKAELTINNLRTDKSSTGLIATFSNLDWTYEPGIHEKRRIIEADVLTSDNPGYDITLTDVTIIYTESNEMSEIKAGGFYASFVMNSTYSFMSYPYDVYAQGTTTVSWTRSSTQDHIDYEPKYRIRLAPSTMTADLSVEGLVLDTRKVDFKLSGQRLGLTAEGYTLTLPSSATVTDADGSQVVIKSLSAHADLRDELDIDAKIEVDGTEYTVSAFLSPDLNVLR